MMQAVTLGRSELVSSRFVYGCMRICGDGSPAARENGKKAIRAAIEAGYTHFDHADIYGDGASETLFAEVLREMPRIRDRLVITSKCGIRVAGQPHPEDPKRYDFSGQYIRRSVDRILARLGIDSRRIPGIAGVGQSTALRREQLQARPGIHAAGILPDAAAGQPDRSQYRQPVGTA